MIVVLIIGVLAAMAGVAFMKARSSAHATAAASDLRTFAGAYEMYTMFEGDWPPDGGPSSIPSGVEEFLKPSQWQNGTPVGGEYDWDFDQFGIWAAISIYRPTEDVSTIIKIDEILDDGNLNTGVFRSRSDGYMYVLEEY